MSWWFIAGVIWLFGAYFMVLFMMGASTRDDDEET